MNMIAFRLLIGCLAACVLLGCGDSPDPLYPVSGTVHFADGTAMTHGTVEFIPDAQGPSAIGQIQPDGSFRLTTLEDFDGARTGEYRIVIIQAGGALLQNSKHAHGRSIAPQYHDANETPLRYTVQADAENKARLVVAAVGG